jgi:hypothetical protein
MITLKSAPALAGGSMVLASAPGLLSTSLRHKMIFLQEFPQNLKDREPNPQKISSLPGLGSGRGRNPW